MAQDGTGGRLVFKPGLCLGCSVMMIFCEINLLKPDMEFIIELFVYW